MTVREPSLSFGPWAKANSHLTSHIHSINYFREFYTKRGLHFSKGLSIGGKYSFSVICDCPLSRNEWTIFIKNGEAKYGVPSGDFLENEKT